MKCYVAGPMTGLPEFNRPNFFKVAQDLFDDGHTVLNPATLPDGLTQKEYMQISGAMLYCCDAIYLLPGWEESGGARAEVALAQKLELEIVIVNIEEEGELPIDNSVNSDNMDLSEQDGKA